MNENIDVILSNLAYIRNELPGLRIALLFPPGESWKGAELFRRLAEHGSARGENHLLRKDGQLVDVEYSAVRAGQDRYQATIHDIGQRKRAAEDREQLLAEVQRRAAELDTIIDSIASGLIIYRPDGEIVRMNRVASDMLGLSAEELKMTLPERADSMRLTKATGQPYGRDDLPVERALRGETVSGEVVVLHRPPDRTLWLSACAAPICAPDGRILGPDLIARSEAMRRLA